MLPFIKICFLLLFGLNAFGQHPLTFFTPAEATAIKKDLHKYPLLQKSYLDIKADTDKWLGKVVDVPIPKDAAGGYTHDKHKQNYMLIFNSAVLYNLTGDTKYADLVKNVLLKYADINPSLPKHPQATSPFPGKIFWQSLNDANWLVYAGMAYDLTRNAMLPNEKKLIEDKAFKPIVDFVTKDLESWFNLIHNHAVWACAGVGMVGIATGNKEYIDMALYGSKKDGKAGFIALMDGLFSPDGYYTEGPYYVRYALLPYFLFAAAINNARPELKIFQHRNNILQKAFNAALQQTNTDGTFFALNDALKEKDITANEIITATNIAAAVYDVDEEIKYVASKQQKLLLNKGGLNIAKAIAGSKKNPASFPYKTVEFGDGKNGREGGVSFLRNGKGNDLTTLIYKYSSHGLSHGHFDKLNYNLFDKGNEIISDYGAVRFIGIEQKFGGRYLPETKTYAAQTIAHNTIVANETSHFNGKESIAENYHSDKLFSSIDTNVQVVMARENNAYKGIGLQRTVYLLQLPDGKKILADIFSARSDSLQQYDLPFHYNGDLIWTNTSYQSFTDAQQTLGKANGYQHLWKEAEAAIKDTLFQLTFLNDKTYYSISSLIQGDATVYFTRSGANDPDFNLRREPGIVIRKKDKKALYVSLLEIHGSFDPISEFSTDTYTSVKQIEMLHQDAAYVVAAVTLNNTKLIIAQANSSTALQQVHRVAGFEWTGPVAVYYDGKQLNKSLVK